MVTVATDQDSLREKKYISDLLEVLEATPPTTHGTDTTEPLVETLTELTTVSRHTKFQPLTFNGDWEVQPFIKPFEQDGRSQ